MRRNPTIPLLALGVPVLALASLMIGADTIALADLLHDPQARLLIVAGRLPRTIAAILTGAALAAAGLIMQILSRNRFVEPATAGTAQSAALGIVLVTLLAPGWGLPAKMMAAILAALAGTAGFLALVSRLPVHQPLLVPLTGLVYGGVIGAAVSFTAYEADLLQYVDIWTNGEFSAVVRGRYEMLWVAAGAAALTYAAADQLTIVGLGRDTAINLGLGYRQVMALGLLAVSVVTAVTVVTVGLVPFVGLVVPNIVSRICGDNLRRSLPLVALTGAGLVLGCDILGRIVRHPHEVPVGTVMGIVGAVTFLWLLNARRSDAR
ncbi:ABC transporter permease [Pukyongiella litopenaei]|uniref:Iron chelate uptake ABC transporter family permease subunit n=1 Tax=Pukyongiella litopenaei TaxID=2605946 RepID=A0A2S0MU36_9RHOB|nr:iron chelate uptake ABC transporter family permease subunit [Pukyongiella litopenaei]AVO39414.1 iron chelate uptake ABC transporter family permease subunit [Pukyongiella litopenaei]